MFFKKIKITIIYSVILILSASAIGCSKSESVSQTTNKMLPVIKLQGGDSGIANPFRTSSQGSGGQYELIYDSLLEKDEKGDIPWLAKKWEISSDGKEYTFFLHDNVKWHDGEIMTSEDVKFTFEYYKNHPPVNNELLIDGKYIIQKIDVIDKNTVKIIFDRASSTYLEKIGSMRIIPKHIWEKVDDPLKFEGKEATVGCGPFQLEEYNPQQGTYRITGFKDYWGLKPVVEAIEWVPVSDAVMAFENSEIDLISITPDILSRYENKDEFKLIEEKTNHGNRLVFNMNKRSELQDINVRKAIAYGINREEMVEKIARGAGIVGSMGTVPINHKLYDDKVVKYNYDVEKSKRFLGNKNLTFDIVARNSNDEVKIAELMKISLQKVGITLNIKSVDNKTRGELVKNNDYEMTIYKTGFGQDPDYLRTYYGASLPNGGVGGYYNQKLYDLGQQELNEMDPEKRKDIIFKMQELVSEEVPQIILYTTNENYVFRPKHFDGWMFRYDRNRSATDLYKLTYLEKK